MNFKLMPGPTPHANCDRCGMPCEHPTESAVYFEGMDPKFEDNPALICADCSELGFTDIKKFFQEGWRK